MCVVSGMLVCIACKLCVHVYVACVCVYVCMCMVSRITVHVCVHM